MIIGRIFRWRREKAIKMNEIYYHQNKLQSLPKKLHYGEVLPRDKYQMIIVEFKNKR